MSQLGDITFTLDERDRRWARIRELMGQQGVDILIVFPQWMAGDALYVANRTGAVIFPAVGDPMLISPRPEPNPPASAWIRDVRGATSTGTTAVPYGAAVATALRDMGADRKRIAVAGLQGAVYTLVRQPEGYANYTSVSSVREALPNATIVDGSPILSEARYVKSEQEIEAIRRSVQIAEASADALAEHARPGVAEAEVFAHMVFEQLRHGADAAHVAWVGGPWGQRAPRCLGAPPGVMQTGWFVNNEIEPSVRGYTCQIDQPVSVGPAALEAKDMFEVGKVAFERACEVMKPGVTWGEVERQVKATAKSAAYELEFLLHGRGLGNDGPMLIPSDTHEHVKNDPIRANTVFILKPYAYRTGGPNYDEGHRINVTWGDSVVVRHHGAERLGTRLHTLITMG